MLTRQDSDSSMTDPPDLISRSEDWEIANSTPGAEQGMHQHLVTPAPTEGLESPPREGDPSGLPSAVDIENKPPTPLWLTRRKHHGDIMEPEKDDRHVRLVLQNLMRLPVMKQADRSTQFLAALRDINPDGVLMSDVGIQWANLMIEHSWIERTTGVLAPHRFRFSCNSHENTGTQVQWGGTGLLCMGEFRSRTHGNMSQDTHNLGRWTSARIQGRHDFFLRVVSAYKPCKNTSDMGSSYQQQLRYFRSINDMRCPRELFDLHLQHQLQEWLAAGEQIILGLDMNEDVRTGNTAQMLHQLGLRDVILTMHPDNPPETNYKNNHNTPIDALFATPGIRPSKGGFLPYMEVMNSDHRCLWIDIPFESALGYNPPNLHQCSPRLVKSKDPRSVQAFVKATKRLMDKQPSFLSKFQHLQTLRSNKGPVHEIISMHSTLLEENNQMRSEAARLARHVYRGKHAWSPDWQQHKDLVWLWKMCLKRFDPTKKVQARYLRRLMRQCGQPDALKLTKEEVQLRLSTAEDNFALNCTRADTLRAEYVKQLAESLAKKNDTSVESEMKKLSNIRNQKTRARRLRRARLKPSKGLATRLLERMPDGSRRMIEDQDNLVRVSAAVNCERFTRCSDCVFLQEQALHEIGLLADGPAVAQIMAGTYSPPPEWEPTTKAFVANLAMPQVVKNNPMPPTVIDKNNHQKGWKRQKETTAGEPTALDFSMHIAAAYDELLAEIDSTLRSVPLEFGFSPPDYERLTDASIPKKITSLEAELMRTICLMNPAYNMNNKEFGRRIMAYCERHGLLADAQSGSRKGRRAGEVALQKVLTMDILRQQRRSGFLCSNDALQCYDRIAHNVAIMSMMSRGADPKALRSLFATLQNADHCVMTGYGASEPQYSGKTRKQQGLLPPQGVLQGNGMGPFVWVLISTIMCICMELAGHTSNLEAVLTSLAVALVGYIFVDDCDTTKSAKDNDTPALEILPEFQEQVDYWEGLLRSTGGALEPAKTFWYLIDFKWTGNRWEYHSVADSPGEVTMRLPDSQERVTLRRLEPDEASKTLGIHIAMDGNQEAQTQYLKDKGIEFSDAYRCATGIEKNDAWEGWLSTIMATFRYPAIATTMTESQWDEVMKPVSVVGLNKSGISRNFPRSVLFGPDLFQGMGVIHPFHFQELEHWETILRCCNDESTTGKLIQISVENLRFELGVPGMITEWDYYVMEKCATPSWIKSVWKYGWDYALDLHDKWPQLPLRRTNDHHLMELFAQHTYSAQDLKTLNECRMYLRAVTLADICTADGKEVSMAAFDGIYNGLRANSYKFPRQPTSLPAGHWTLWKKALSTLVLRTYSESGRRLRVPLGQWLCDPSEHWPWFYRAASSVLYHKSTQGWERFTARRGVRPGSVYISSGVFEETLPHGARPATVTPWPRHPNHVTFNCYSREGTRPQDTPQKPATMQESLELLDDSSRWAVSTMDLGNHHPNHQGGNVAASILQGTCKAVCDGSYKDGHGTAAFRLQGEDPAKAVQGCNVTPGRTQEQCAYRSELGGLVGVLTTLQVLCDTFQVDSGKATVGIDCESLIKRLSNPKPLNVTESHFDMLTECRRRMKILPCQVILRWVEGHQDSKFGFHPLSLDWWARTNITMDANAKRHWRNTKGQAIPNQVFKHEICAAILAGEKISAFRKAWVHEQVNEKPVRDYWQTKNSITDEQWDDVNWPATKKALQEQPLGLRRFLGKFATSHIATGKMMRLRRHWPHSKCPVCGAEVEDTKHVLQCPKSRAIWNEAVNDLAQWMKDQDTQPEVAKHITNLLQSWALQQPPTLVPLTAAAKQQALQAQSDLGGWNTMMGRISKRITAIQDQRFRVKGSRRSGLRWTVALIKKLQGIAWDMWRHRNGVLHNDPLRHHQRDALEEANATIASEWTRGVAGLLAQDRFLFRDRTTLDAKPLAEKWVWITSVTQARAAAEAAQASQQSFEQERQSMRDWLLRNRGNQDRTNNSTNNTTRQTHTEINQNNHTTNDEASNPRPRKRRRTR